MPTIGDLPADQRAVLDLVLQLDRSYDEVAAALSIERSAVRDRAVAALDALGPQAPIEPERRALITDYLLGELPVRLADEVRAHLAESASERAWARVVASELQPIAKRPLPEIPAGGDVATVAAVPDLVPGPELDARGPAADELSEAADEEDGEPAAERAAEPAAGRAPEARRRPVWAFADPEITDEVAEADSSPPPGHRPVRRPTRRGRTGGVSRPSGAILLAVGGLAVIAAIVVVLVVVVSGNSSKHSTSTPARASTPTTPTTSTTGSQVLGAISLKPPTAGSKALGFAEVLRVKGRVGIAIVAQGLAPNTTHPANAYAVWLYNTPTDSHILGFVNPGVGSTGRLQTAGGLPSNAAHFHQLLITLETRSNPRTPGRIVLQGPLKGV